MLETEITLQREGVALAGTLTQPGGESAVVVICLHGSGPLDRNENMPGQRLDTFNTLANAFAAEGIATYRYDKRGCGASTGTYATASHDELVADARAVISEMRARGFERIVLLGHSEGTLIAAQLASEVQGLVLLAPFIAPLRALLMSQADEMQRVLDTTKGFIAWLNRRIVAALGGTRVLQEQLIAKIEASTTPTLRHYGCGDQTRLQVFGATPRSSHSPWIRHWRRWPSPGSEPALRRTSVTMAAR